MNEYNNKCTEKDNHLKTIITITSFWHCGTQKVVTSPADLEHSFSSEQKNVMHMHDKTRDVTCIVDASAYKAGLDWLISYNVDFANKSINQSIDRRQGMLRKLAIFDSHLFPLHLLVRTSSGADFIKAFP